MDCGSLSWPGWLPDGIPKGPVLLLIPCTAARCLGVEASASPSRELQILQKKKKVNHIYGVHPKDHHPFSTQIRTPMGLAEIV